MKYFESLEDQKTQQKISAGCGKDVAMEKLFELPIKVTREEIPEDFDDFRRYVMETSDGKLVVVSRSEYMRACGPAEAGLKAGIKK